MKAMYLVGEDMALVDSNANHVHEVLSSLDFFVVQDVFLSKTAQYADVVLPAAPSLEKEGTFTNTERRVQDDLVLPTLGDAKPDWWIVQEVANKLGANWNYSHPSEIFAEMASLSPLFSQANYEVLKDGTVSIGEVLMERIHHFCSKTDLTSQIKRLVLRLLTGYVQLNFQLSLTFTLTTVVCLSISMKGI